jgi:hypothetical protein
MKSLILVSQFAVSELVMSAPVKTKEEIPVMASNSSRAALWVDFYRELARRNFVRAVTLARELGIDQARIRHIERDAIKHFLADCQNFEGAARLAMEYRFSVDEICDLTEEVLKRPGLDSRLVFAFQAGRGTHLSVAEQIRAFARRQIELLKTRKGGRIAGWLRRLGALVRSLRQGGFPQGQFALG